MGFLHRLFGVSKPRAESQLFALNDHAFLEMIRSGRSSRAALEVSAVYRCVSLISQAMGMLPLRIMKREAAGVLAEEAFDHPLTKVLGAEPNAAQSAYVFKRLMQLRMLTKGNAYARIVRTGSRVVALVPIDPDRVEPRQNDDGSIVYRVSGAGGTNEIAPRDMLHLFDASLDGIKGISVVELATDAIGLSAAAAQSLRRIYQNGFSSSGAFTHPNKLSKEAKASLREQIETGFSGSENGGRMVMLDEGMDVKLFSTSARDAQTLENRTPSDRGHRALFWRAASAHGAGRYVLGLWRRAIGHSVRALCALALFRLLGAGARARAADGSGKATLRARF
jgi:HK97 family phage portal protein